MHLCSLLITNTLSDSFVCDRWMDAVVVLDFDGFLDEYSSARGIFDSALRSVRGS